MSPKNALIRITWSSVEISADQLLTEDHEKLVLTAVDALRTAQREARDELLFVNIAPGIEVGSPRIGEAQAALERAISEACERLGRDVPEIRLSLRGSEYDLRLYVGSLRPSDFNFDHDA